MEVSRIFENCARRDERANATKSDRRRPNFGANFENRNTRIADLPGPSSSGLNVVDELSDSIDDHLHQQRREKEKPPRKFSRNSTTFAGEWIGKILEIFFRILEKNWRKRNFYLKFWQQFKRGTKFYFEKWRREFSEKYGENREKLWSKSGRNFVKMITQL